MVFSKQKGFDEVVDINEKSELNLFDNDKVSNKGKHITRELIIFYNSIK